MQSSSLSSFKLTLIESPIHTLSCKDNPPPQMVSKPWLPLHHMLFSLNKRTARWGILQIRSSFTSDATLSPMQKALQREVSYQQNSNLQGGVQVMCMQPWFFSIGLLHFGQGLLFASILFKAAPHSSHFLSKLQGNIVLSSKAVNSPSSSKLDKYYSVKQT